MLVLAWVASIAPLVLQRFLELPPASAPFGLTGLVALPWLALAAAPGALPVDAGRRALAWAAAAAPPLALALRVDLVAAAERGEPVALLPLAALAAGLVALLVGAVRAAPAAGRGVHAALWALLVPGLALLGHVLPLADAAPGTGWGIGSEVVRAGPLELALALVVGDPSVPPVGSLVGAALLLLAAEVDRWRVLRRPEEER